MAVVDSKVKFKWYTTSPYSLVVRTLVLETRDPRFESWRGPTFLLNTSKAYYESKINCPTWWWSLSVGGWNKIYPNGTKFTHFLSPYSELPMRFRHQKFTKSDRLVKKLSCNTGLHIIFPVYILKILLPKNYF